MKIYFLSSKPCALTINDAYFGMTDRFERFAEISLKDELFIRFTPENAQPIGFFLTENVRFTPPTGCEVYLLPDALAIYARDFPPSDLTLRILSQKRFEDGVLTLFRQGALQLSMETEQGFFISTLPPTFESAELLYESGLFLIKAPNAIAVFTKKGEQLLLESTLCSEIKAGELCATLPLSDCLGRVADCAWSLSETGITQTKYTLSQARTIDGDVDPVKRNAELLPFAFLQSVLIGADYTAMLSDDLASKAQHLKTYLGKFSAVTLTQEPNVCGLVRKKGERLFEVTPCTITTEQGKITNVQL